MYVYVKVVDNLQILKIADMFLNVFSAYYPNLHLIYIYLHILHC